MNLDRVVQLVAAGVLVLCLIFIALIGPVINADRRDLQISQDVEIGDRVPPRYVLLAASLGSFRGLAANILWYRSEQLKREGKFFEINTLAQWITWLQPRFPRVWEFQAWNMAYNISVQTNTPQERWHWVNRGIRLLREDGIPNNPRSVVLYRQLAWIFFHKVGGSTDDMHWYYKEEMGREWLEILGEMANQPTQEDVLASMGAIADAAERYFVLNRPTREMRTLLQEIISQLDEQDSLRRQAQSLLHAPIGRLYREARQMGPELVARDRRMQTNVDALTALLEEHNRAKRPLAMLYEDAPGAQAIVEQLDQVGIELNRDGLRQVGRFLGLLDYMGPELLSQQIRLEPDSHLRTLSELLMDPGNRTDLDRLLAFWRAKVLLEAYHMDPGYMYILMDRFGPMDWRHPVAHAVYWSSLGVEAAMNLLDRSGIDILNTERQIIHGLQLLTYGNRIHYDPMSGRTLYLPDPRFFPSYELALADAVERYEGTDLGTSGTIASFEGGHENFLRKAVVYSYLYGDAEQANTYYQRIRDLYGERNDLTGGREYRQTLNDFVMNHLRTEVFGESVNTTQMIDAMLTQAFVLGLANNRRDLFTQYLEVARMLQQEHQARRGHPNPNAFEGRERLMLGDFDQLLNATFTELMRSTRLTLVERSRIYNNAPLTLRLATYPQFRGTVQHQAQQSGMNVEAAFPPPPGLDLQGTPLDLDMQRQMAPGSTIQRQ